MIDISARLTGYIHSEGPIPRVHYANIARACVPYGRVSSDEIFSRLKALETPLSPTGPTVMFQAIFLSRSHPQTCCVKDFIRKWPPAVQLRHVGSTMTIRFSSPNTCSSGMYSFSKRLYFWKLVHVVSHFPSFGHRSIWNVASLYQNLLSPPWIMASCLDRSQTLFLLLSCFVFLHHFVSVSLPYQTPPV